MDEQGHWQEISPLEQSESGVLNNWLDKIATRQRIQTPSIIVRRDVYEQLGMFDSRLSSCEDWEMWVRIATKYPLWYETEPLALYRVRSNSNTEIHMRTGKEIQNLRNVIGIIKDYLPNESAHRLSQIALKNYALYGITNANIFASNGDIIAAMKLIFESLKCNYSFKVVRFAVRSIISAFYINFVEKKHSNSIT